MTQYFIHTRKMPELVAGDGGVYTSCVFDRSKTILTYEDIVDVIPLGKFTTPKTITDISDERAQTIINAATSEGKKIYVYWSGGIDSTLALVALLKQADPSQLVVVMNDSSIQEYPEFYYTFIKDKLKIEFVENKTKFAIKISPDKYLKDGVICTGELGDQIIGSGKYDFFPDKYKFMLPWKSWFQGAKTLDKFEAFVAGCPAPIVTAKDFWWWFNYGLKYTANCFRMLTTSKDGVLEKNVFHFFHSADWNDYAVSTPSEEKFYGTDIREYKMPYKQYIYDFTKDRSYLHNKIKVGSLYTMHANLNPFQRLLEWKAVTTNWEREY